MMEERTDGSCTSASSQTEKDIPEVPIKTWKWEDVRRSRKRGAYPWTHLNKPPLDEEVDPEEFTMEAFRRSRSTSTVGKSETQEAREFTNDIIETAVKRLSQINGDNNPEYEEVIQRESEPSNPEYEDVTKLEASQEVQQQVNVNNGGRAKSEEPAKKRRSSIESSYSRISLSKLGLVQKLKSAKSLIRVPRLPKRSRSDVTESKRPKKLTKTSVTSKSQPSSSQSIPTRLPSDETPVYIYIPLNPPPGEVKEFSKSEATTPKPETGEDEASATRISMLEAVHQIKTQLLRAERQRIRESQERLNSEMQSQEKLNLKAKEETPEIQSGEVEKDITTEAEAEVEGAKPEQAKPEETRPEKVEPEESKPEERKLEYTQPQETKSEEAKSEEPQSTNLEEVKTKATNLKRNESERLVIEDITDTAAKTPTTESKKPDFQKQSSTTQEPIVIEPEENSDASISNYLDDRCEIVSQISEQISTNSALSKEPEASTPLPEETTLDTVEAGTSKPEDASKPENLSKLDEDVNKAKPSSSKPKTEITVTHVPLKDSRQVRAKSEEPKRKRKTSADSSYSRKSLSKVGVLKKRLKEATSKITLPKFPSFSKGDRKTSPKSKPESESDFPKPSLPPPTPRSTVVPDTEPRYIYIPLKLPEGVTDEFSKFADENYVEPKAAPEELSPKDVSQPPSDPEPQTPQTPETPESPEKHVQLIFLTPPSDDEVLDGPPTVPQTPTEHGKFFENQKIDDLKNLAKSALQQLEPVIEEKSDTESVKSGSKIPKNQEEEPKRVVDEGDGLIAASEDRLQEKPPSGIKKKVSFKKKSKAEDGERIYEDIEIVSDEKTKKEDQEQLELKKEEQEKEEQKLSVKKLDLTQSMSVDEEKTYLDQKIVKDTSLEDDYNKWSKPNDHEYEPINLPPPSEETTKPPPSPVLLQPGNNHLQVRPSANISLQSSTTSLDRHLLGNLSQPDVSKRETDILNVADQRAQPSEETTQSFEAENQENVKNEENEEMKSEDHRKQSFSDAVRDKAGKIRERLQSIKAPHVSLPKRPKFSGSKIKKLKFERPKIKLPDAPKITLPTFNFTRKDDDQKKKKAWRERQFSTESNVGGDSKKKIFDFSTYPRILKKKKASTSSSQETENTSIPPEFATVPRKGPRWGRKKEDEFKNSEGSAKESATEHSPKSVRIPLHPEEKEETNEVVPSHTRYGEDIDIEDEYEPETPEIPSTTVYNKEYLKRWQHGEFHPQEEFEENYKVTDLDDYNEHVHRAVPAHSSFHSSGSLSEEHRRGVLEEIDSDEFFLRQKGISQEDIEVGKYLSSEIRDAFRNPVNALQQLRDGESKEYELDASDQSGSVHEVPSRRKPLKKPKRKKTPHVSREDVSFDLETEPEEYPKHYAGPPSRPRRKSKKSKKKKEVVPYQETIRVERDMNLDTLVGDIESEIIPGNILGDDRPVGNSNGQREEMGYDEEEEIGKYLEHNNQLNQEQVPIAPARKQRSLKSLNASEPDSITEEFNSYRDDGALQEDDEVFRAKQEYIIPTPEPPVRPKRLRSRTRSQSLATTQDEDHTSPGADLSSESQVPCTEEPCCRDLRDAMGYAIIDKTKARNPPLPPSRIPRTPPARRSERSPAGSEERFFTTPRASSSIESVPMRPVRNYSTLGPNRPPRKRSSSSLFNEEKKENLNSVTPYTEIEEGEGPKRLQSGDVIQKMRDRPLPAPPRPPRRTRGCKEVLADITHESNNTFKTPDSEEFDDESYKSQPVSSDYSTATLVADQSTTVESSELDDSKTVAQEEFYETKEDGGFDNTETVTHGSLVVQPLGNFEIIPYSQLTIPNRQPVERTIPVSREEVDDESTSEIPEDFKKLKNPEGPKSTLDSTQEVELLKAQKLQVGDLDVDKLRVNELQASKIIVSELDGVTLQVSEINSRSGNLVVSGIELPPNFIQDVIDKIHQSAATQAQQVPRNQEKARDEDDEDKKADPGQKKTPFEFRPIDSETAEVPSGNSIPEQFSLDRREFVNILESELLESMTEQAFEHDNPEILERTTAPPSESYPHLSDTSGKSEDPPPRPPHPSLDVGYLPSQPPPGFYMLRSPHLSEFVEDIPMAPRRKRHKCPPQPRSSSDEEEETPLLHPPRRHLRTGSTPVEPTVTQLTGQLARVCASEVDRAIKRLITHFKSNVLSNVDGSQDLNVMIIILLVLIAGLVLLGGDTNVTVHHHHWEYFNPPKDL